MKRKNLYISFAAVTAALLLVILCVFEIGTFSINAAEKDGSSSDTVTVTGTYSVFATPDMAEISFGVESKGKSASEAQKTNTGEVNKVIAKLKELGVAEKSIVTSGYNIYQDYDYEKNEPNGYVVTTNLTVKDIKIADAGTILSDCVEAGVNFINNISYKCSDYDAQYEKALSEAVSAAKTKADVLASAAGRSTGKVMSLVEGYQNTQYKYANTSVAAEAAASADMAMGIMPGESEITATVTVTWYLE